MATKKSTGAKPQKQKLKSYTFNTEQLKELEMRLKGKIIFEAYEVVMDASMLVWRDSYGFGAGRLGRYCKKSLEMLKDIEARRLDFDDCKDTIHKETGVEVDFRRSEKRII